MEVFKILTSNYLINVGLTAWLCAQMMKTVLVYFATGKVEWERMVGAGGMPSAHSALVCSIAVGMVRKVGFASPEFALSLTLAGIVMYDAMGVRRAAGEQAKILNLMLQNMRRQTDSFWNSFTHLEEDLDSTDADLARKNSKDELARAITAKLDEKKELKEYLGHTPLQVLAGALLGILIAMIMPVI